MIPYFERESSFLAVSGLGFGTGVSIGSTGKYLVNEHT
jgi:hypothetical protein